MDSEMEIVEERVKSFLDQLKVEQGILDRMVYKNKNQHRRCSYFQYLMKVRRDLRLLQSAHLEEIVSSSFLVINGKRAKQKVQLLESLKRRKSVGKHNFLERLLGAARLLSQIVEPIVKAATEISKLLAQSFFMGFSLTILGLLARLRVLIQQILLDVVTVFNAASSLSRKEQSVKLTQDGLEVFRDLYPTNEGAVYLECEWQADKFVLLERTSKCENNNQIMDVGEDASAIQYQSIGTLLAEDEPVKSDPISTSEQIPANIKEGNPSFPEVPDDKAYDGEPVEDDGKMENSSSVVGAPSKNDVLAHSSPPSKLKRGLKNKVAFISVKRPALSTVDKIELPIKETQSSNGKEDPFFNLLTGGNLKDSLF